MPPRVHVVVAQPGQLFLEILDAASGCKKSRQIANRDTSDPNIVTRDPGSYDSVVF